MRVHPKSPILSSDFPIINCWGTPLPMEPLPHGHPVAIRRLSAQGSHGSAQERRADQFRHGQVLEV